MADRRVKRRGGHRGEATKLISEILAVCRSGASPNTEEYAALAQSRVELCRQRDIILKLDDDILEEIEDDNIAADIAESSRVSMKIAACLTKVDQILSVVAKQEVKREELSKNVKLPTITLPKFDGCVLDWQQFWDLYETTIHNRTDIGDASKFHYLLSQLTGEAAQLMVGFNHTNAEYSEAVNLLKNTYGNVNKLMEAHLHAIFDIPTPQTSSKELSKFRSCYEGHLRGLKSLGANVDDAGYVYAALLLRKLPAKIRDNLNREGKKDFWDLKELRTSIETEIGHLQAMESATNGSPWDSSVDEFRVATTEKSTAMTMHVSSRDVQRCSLCSKTGHFAGGCSKFITTAERRGQVQKMGLCFNCLRPGHRSSDCNSKGRCRKCSRKHHTSICEDNNDSQIRKYSAATKPLMKLTTSKEKLSPNPTVSKGNATVSTAAVSGVREPQKCATTALPTALIKIVNGVSEFSTRALLDQGSQRTFVLRSVVNRVHLPVIRNVQLSINGFGSTLPCKVYDVVQFVIRAADEDLITEAIVVDTLPNILSMPGRSESVRTLLKVGIKLADATCDSDSFTDISLLIGADQFYNFVHSDQINGVSVIPSKLGTLISGPLPCVSSEDRSNVETVTVLKVGVSEHDLDSKLEKFWSLDSVGILSPSSVSDEAAISDFKDCVRFENGKFVANLPWKSNHPELPSNFFLAKRRLESNLSSLRKNRDQLAQYNDVIKTQLNRGFIEEVTHPFESNNLVHYIPHHCVLKESLTTPLRVVFDCSARLNSKSPSLNDCLFSGPCMLNELVAVLLRFRAFDFACLSDIEKAFLMINLNEQDRDVARFLWKKDPFDPLSEIIIYRFKVVFFGANCSQFLLNMSLKKHLDNSNLISARKLEMSLYVDNVVHSSRTEEELIEFHDESNELMSRGGFNLREWNSNSPKLNRLIDGRQNYSCPRVLITNVLGISWDTCRDVLTLKSLVFSCPEVLTKRHILSQSSRIFDPFGSIIPVTINARMLMQDLWQLKVGWDERLPETFVGKWKSLVEDLSNCMSVTVPRSLSLKSHITLCAFCDSSLKAYGAVVYVRSGKNVNFLIAKARVVPIKSPSLPQLELTAANLAARLVAYVKTSYACVAEQISVHIWCDSQIVLAWLKKSKVSKPYVQQRLDDIERLVPEAVWHYVPSSENPADILSRGLKGSEFLRCSIWFNGPKWLREDSSYSRNVVSDQNLPSLLNVQETSEPNEQKEVPESLSVGCTTIFSTPEVDTYCARFSSYGRLLRVTAYVVRFFIAVSLRVKGQLPQFQAFLSTPEISETEVRLIKCVQLHFFPTIVEYFSDPNIGMPSLVKQLRLQFVDGLIRCRGRLEFSILSEHAKCPILLPSRSHFTNLLIDHVHRYCLHAGINHVLSVIREKFWIPSGRQRVKSRLSRCIVCKRHHGRTVNPPNVAPYPEYRVKEAVPFSVTGVDYTGALYVRQDSIVRKVYVCLFTCMSSRALHLELVGSGTAEDFLLAFRRFVARRSCPEVMMSDNATIFCSSAVNLKRICEQERVTNALSTLKIDWKFIPSRAPHFGGVWERLIGITKTTLKKVLGKSLISFTELNTVLCEVESTINDRPLTHLSSDINDDPLTPSHLLYGRRIRCLANVGFQEDELEDPTLYELPSLSERQLRVRLVFKNLWSKWKSEYLATLRERDRDLIRNGETNLAVGDIVLIHDESSRSAWNIGRITALHAGHDGIVRAAELKTRHGLVSRPIIKLVPLEISSEGDSEIAQAAPAQSVPCRPERAAAARARKLCEQQLNG